MYEALKLVNPYQGIHLQPWLLNALVGTGVQVDAKGLVIKDVLPRTSFTAGIDVDTVINLIL